MIDLVDVSKSYGPGLPAVNHANLHVDKGEFVFVVGSSGSGKSTLIKLLMKELDSTSGTITVSGERLEKMKHRRVAKYRRKLGVVFQDFRLLKDRNVLLKHWKHERDTIISKHKGNLIFTRIILAEKSPATNFCNIFPRSSYNPYFVKRCQMKLFQGYLKI